MLWLLLKMMLWQQIIQKFLTVFRPAMRHRKIQVITTFILQQRRLVVVSFLFLIKRRPCLKAQYAAFCSGCFAPAANEET